MFENYSISGYSSTGNYFTADFRDGKIYKVNSSGSQHIGYGISYVNELEQRTKEYMDRLKELGEFPKTPQEIAQDQVVEQAKINEELLNAIKSLNEKVDKLDKKPEQLQLEAPKKKGD